MVSFYLIFNVILYSDDEESADQPDKEARQDLREGMLSKNHASRSHHSCQEDDEGKPPSGVEGKAYGIDYQGSRYSTDGSGVGRYFPPHVDEGANHLYDQCRYQDDADDPWRVAIFHEEEATEVA